MIMDGPKLAAQQTKVNTAIHSLGDTHRSALDRVVFAILDISGCPSHQRLSKIVR